MKITDLEVIVLRYEYPPGGGFWFAGGYCNARLSCLVMVHTDEGISGMGSVYSHPDLTRTIVEGHLRDLLLGEDPCEVERLQDLTYRATRWYGRKGVAVTALGGLDTALWDIRGKVAGKPIYRLLGGTCNSVPAYASALLWQQDPADLSREAARHVANGFRAMKMRLGRSFEYDCAALRGVREAVGRDVHLMVDGNARYSLEQAVRMAPVLKDNDAYWFEEPFPPESPESFRALRPFLNIPLAAGENEFGLQGFRELIDNSIVDIVQPDCARCGGLTEAVRIVRYARHKGLRLATHTWNDAVALVSNMHLMAGLSSESYIEIDQTGSPLISDLLAEPLRVVAGRAVLPDQPGLGIQLNEEFIECHRVPANVPIPASNYSDMVFGREHWSSAPSYDLDPQAILT
ncbi:MAG: mandelate racemase/muconate lactonizing enzyme family protein [Bryobacterales bacterium]|nr:mandelate racemase/muconate lactonizing enzyme family protein [Bryobacteraceae bacterium]MCZ2077032.1 mandelate racemase/muconate lactonizing enzyme family protein [Bryobacterales bacterium]